MHPGISFNTIIAGRFFEETIINKKDQVFINKPGGNVLYAAAGFSLWNRRAGLLSKIYDKQSTDWMKDYQECLFNTSGFISTPRRIDHRKFYRTKNSTTVIEENPQRHFFDIGIPFPKSLLGYQSQCQKIDSKKTPSAYSIQPEDISQEYLQANNVLLCPVDFYTHSILPPFFRSQTNGNIIQSASDGYMHPSFIYDVPSLIRGVTVFITKETQLRYMFMGKSDDLHEMVDFLISSGIEIAVIFNNSGSNYVCDATSNSMYKIPNYSTRVVDVVGTYAAFCGGFAAGFFRYFDPSLAGLMGAISASFNLEGSTPFHTMNTLPDLALARLGSLKKAVVKI